MKFMQNYRGTILHITINYYTAVNFVTIKLKWKWTFQFSVIQNEKYIKNKKLNIFKRWNTIKNKVQKSKESIKIIIIIVPK